MSTGDDNSRDGDASGPAFDDGRLESSLLVEHFMAPGGLAPAARASDHDRYAYVFEGQVTARVGRETLIAGPGTIVSIPRGFRHAMWNTDGRLARVLVLHVFGPRPGLGREVA